MSRRTTLFATCQVMPFEAEDGEGGKEEGKQLVFTDSDGGEIILYPMGKKLAEEVGRKLKMSNKSLVASLEEAARRLQAQAMLSGGNGTPVPGEQQAIDDILRGVHRKEGE